MNIKEAKDEIKNAITAYFTKNEFGDYVIPLVKQRPVFLMGPPGIGKTAIMEQIAQELGVGLVSYSMTHHTRQSALGLPFIEDKVYGGKQFKVSEYTMSEIIASVYDMIEQTGIKEGILFLDEINCVSETLAPAMLQFLQYKIFGRHQVPNGWIVVTAGNPPEYNNSVREFDIVTWDRLKRVDVEADYKVWKEYALKSNTHPAITTYLDIKNDDFYRIETTVDGKTFVTARGWSDLSDMIRLYEQNNIPVKYSLVIQYLQNPKIAKNFAVYYDLFNKYKSDYQVDKILDGTETLSIQNRARSAKFDERISLIGLLMDAIYKVMKDVCNEEDTLLQLLLILKELRQNIIDGKDEVVSFLKTKIKENSEQIESGKRLNLLNQNRLYELNRLSQLLDNDLSLVIKSSDSNKQFKLLKDDYDAMIKSHNLKVKKATDNLNNLLKFSNEVYGDGQETLIIVTEITLNDYCVQFISKYGCEEYTKHSKNLRFYERRKEIDHKIEDLGL